MARSGRRMRIRDATRDCHHRVDSLLRRGGFFSDLEGYQCYLQAGLIARVPLEAQVGPLDLRAPPGFLVADAMRQDLADLCGAPPAAAPGARPCEEAAAWGVLYVLGGSSLGAQQLLRWAMELGLTGDRGARHLWRQTRDVRAWRAFVATFDALDMTDDAEAACLAGARAAFGRFEDAFRRRLDD